MSRLLALIPALVCAPASSEAATIATDVAPTAVAAEPTPAVIAPPLAPVGDTPAPRDVVLGMVSIDVFMATDRDRNGGRIGMDMLSASGDGAVRAAGGLRMLLGGGAGFGPEVALKLGVAHAINDRTVVALVAPLGGVMSGRDELGFHGYAGLETIAAFGERGRHGGFARLGVELAAEISNRGARARVGIIKAGKGIGAGIGVQWQRDGDAEMIGLFFAETPGSDSR